MSIQELAKSFTGLCAAGKFDQAGEQYWSEAVVSREPMGAVATGLAAVIEKGKGWAANHEIHGVKIEGPFVSGDQFIVRFTMDITAKEHGRMTMDELGVYTVKDGKIVEESFFYAS